MVVQGMDSEHLRTYFRNCDMVNLLHYLIPGA